MKSFREHLMELYPNYELHNRHVRDDDVLAQDMEYDGENYRIRVFDAQVIHWHRVRGNYYGDKETV